MAEFTSDSDIAGGSDLGAASDDGDDGHDGDNDGASPASGGGDGSGGDDTDQGLHQLVGKVQRRLKTQVVRPFVVEQTVQPLITTTQEQEQQELDVDNVDKYNAQKQGDVIKKELLSDRRGALALKTGIRQMLDLSPSSSADSDGDLDALEILQQRQEQEKKFYLYMAPSPAGEYSNASSPRLSESTEASSDEEIEVVDLESNEFSEQEHENGNEFADMESSPSTTGLGADDCGSPSLSTSLASPSTPSSAKDEDQLKTIHCQNEELAPPATAVDENSSNSSSPTISSNLKSAETTFTGEDDIQQIDPEGTSDSPEGQKQELNVVPTTPVDEQSSNPPTSSASERVETPNDKEVELIDSELETYNQQDHENVDESVGSRASAPAASTTQLGDNGHNGVSVSTAPSALAPAPLSNANVNSTDTEGNNENNGRASPLLAWVGPPMCINCGRTFDNLRALRDHVLSVHPGPGTGKYKGSTREQASSSTATSEAPGASANGGGKAKGRNKSSSRKRPNSAEAETNPSGGGGGKPGRKRKRQTSEPEPLLSGPSPISSKPTPTPTRDDLEQQIKVYQDAVDGKRFGCPGCERRFLLRSALLDHLRVHTGEKPYVCPHRSCNRPFRRNDNLLRHLRTNHGGQLPTPT